jgi:hypothetical protein
MLQGTTPAPLNHYFFDVFKRIFFKIHIFQKNILYFFVNTIMLRCIFKKIQNMFLKYSQTMLLISKLFLNNDYKSLKK